MNPNFPGSGNAPRPYQQHTTPRAVIERKWANAPIRAVAAELGLSQRSLETYVRRQGIKKPRPKE